MSKQKLPQGGGSFVRQPDGGLKQAVKPAADPVQKSAKPTPAPSPKKEAK
ncbi:hypothetical protein [Parasedimentitalea huanghaiensis]|nr:hypothetical protein [Zongyanglinia huanghaiensis]